MTRRRLRLAAIAVGLCGFAVWSGAASGFGGLFGPLSGLNAVLYDASIGVAGRLHPRDWSQTLILLVDQRTLDTPGWAAVPRALQQPQLARLADIVLSRGARRVGFDFVLAVDPAAIALPFSLFSAYDARFTTLLRSRGDQLVLGVDATMAPAARYTALLPRTALGAIDLQTETDGVVRSVPTWTRRADGQRVLGFAQALAGAAGGLASGHAFVAPRASIEAIPHLSAAALEPCLATPEQAARLTALIRGRTVLIGAGLAGEDAHRGPDRFLPKLGRPAGPGEGCGGQSERLASREGGLLPGVFLQAAATESLMDPAPLVLADGPVRVLTNLAVALLALMVLGRIDRGARLPDRRAWLFAGTLRASIALVSAFAAAAAAAVALEAAVVLLTRTWLPIGPTLAAVAVFGGAQTLGVALRRDIALADLRVSFGRWLPAPVVEATLAARPGAVIGRERTITVLIADLMDFTTFCARHRHEPERIVTALNRRFAIAQQVIDRHGGCLDKFDGDAVIAFWNGIEDQPDHAWHAVAAARDIVAADRDDEVLRFKCAVATGVAFVGRYGSERKSSFSAIGEPMNLAARLETLCRTHGLRIVIAEATRDACLRLPRAGLAPGAPRLSGRIGDARLKGFAEAMAFFTLAEEGASRPADGPSLADPLPVEHEA